MERFEQLCDGVIRLNGAAVAPYGGTVSRYALSHTSDDGDDRLLNYLDASTTRAVEHSRPLLHQARVVFLIPPKAPNKEGKSEDSGNKRI